MVVSIVLLILSKERSENESESAWLSGSMSYRTEQFGLFGPDIIPR